MSRRKQSRPIKVQDDEVDGQVPQQSGSMANPTADGDNCSAQEVAFTEKKNGELLGFFQQRTQFENFSY